eukprot:CAMPEP_0177282572 /NCGR_PEP_ID=MMETSP0367-20130122/71533_1 /TAXON_ID=447022 ORGANISM="Scrippsiella hangoei-like, Strain SHHI-4" /NCGR_SAMPLE_ID=MMETSP0367 /ASSEMBLY_ACC=CAM_ASM_000362 /LENGTH=81 /DNA_ID=CAMNT_0018739505 /DNA_START=24 /DNA_END=267 /DNA_ORIENTATION=-
MTCAGRALVDVPALWRGDRRRRHGRQAVPEAPTVEDKVNESFSSEVQASVEKRVVEALVEQRVGGKLQPTALSMSLSISNS